MRNIKSIVFDGLIETAAGGIVIIDYKRARRTQCVRQRRTAIFCRVTIVLFFAFKEKKKNEKSEHTRKYFFSVGSPIRFG